MVSRGVGIDFKPFQFLLDRTIIVTILFEGLSVCMSGDIPVLCVC